MAYLRPAIFLPSLGSQAWGLWTGPLVLAHQAIQNLPNHSAGPTPIRWERSACASLWPALLLPSLGFQACGLQEDPLSIAGKTIQIMLTFR